MSPGEDKRSSKRRSKDDGSRRDDRRHKRSRSRSPTRKKHRRSESRRRKKRSKSKRRSHSSSSSSTSSLSSSQVEKKKRRKSKHLKKRKHRHRCSDESGSDCNDTPKQTPTINNKSAINNDSKTESGDKKQVLTEPKQPEPVVQSEAKGPMTQAQYLQLNSQIREVVDPSTGRVRLVRGTGEIIERIVSRSEHQNLNAQATRGDGDGYARQVARQAMQRRMGR